MSIIFGIRKPEGDTVADRQLTELAHATERWAPDGTFVLAKGRIGMGVQPYHTHRRSNLELQPAIDELGNMATIDGRLDNHKELRALLGIRDSDTSDSLIVLAAFRCWGEECFAKFIGDWALSVWSEEHRSLYLARDHAGTRTMYFEERERCIYWSTYLDTLVADGAPRDLDDTYSACYITRQPIRNLTPYKKIKSIPPAHYQVFSANIVTKAHWSWTAKNTINYKAESDYDEHFYTLFRQSVQRRIDEGAPILAQLSGGMDSSSIICMSDSICREQGANSDCFVDTISYYDDSEPNWNERPYFSLIEAERSKPGIHLETSFRNQRFDHLSKEFNCCLPGAVNASIERERVLEEVIAAHGYRVIVSGIGGDELLGGVPTPLPELADIFVSGNIPLLLNVMLDYCLFDRTPLIHMFGKTLRYLCGVYGFASTTTSSVPSWAHPRIQDLLERQKRNDTLVERRFTLNPSMIDNASTWWSMLESLPHKYPAVLSRREYRYPYLDRDLVDFLMRVPRSQLVKPGRRRNLMRRALKNIVPSEILERRRKASLLHGPLACLQQHENAIEKLLADPTLEALRLIDAPALRNSLTAIQRGSAPAGWPSILKAIAFACWLRAKGSELRCEISK
jgi:asparagine synthase (glutamine-hydrolysing)